MGRAAAVVTHSYTHKHTLARLVPGDQIQHYKLLALKKITHPGYLLLVFEHIFE